MRPKPLRKRKVGRAHLPFEASWKRSGPQHGARVWLIFARGFIGEASTAVVTRAVVTCNTHDGAILELRQREHADHSLAFDLGRRSVHDKQQSPEHNGGTRCHGDHSTALGGRGKHVETSPVVWRGARM